MVDWYTVCTTMILPWYIEFWRFPHPKYFIAAFKYCIWQTNNFSLFEFTPLLTRSSPAGAAPSIYTIQPQMELTFKSSIFKFSIYVLGFLSLCDVSHGCSWSKCNVTVIAQWSEHAASWRVRQSTVDSDRTSDIAIWSSHEHVWLRIYCCIVIYCKYMLFMLKGSNSSQISRDTDSKLTDQSRSCITVRIFKCSL